MAQIIPGKTNCCICGEPIASATDAIGFPAFVPYGHEFERYSDCAFHYGCFMSWDKHERFQKLYDDYKRIWGSRPKELTLEEFEAWGKAAFDELFARGMTKKTS